MGSDKSSQHYVSQHVCLRAMMISRAALTTSLASFLISTTTRTSSDRILQQLFCFVKVCHFLLWLHVQSVVLSTDKKNRFNSTFILPAVWSECHCRLSLRRWGSHTPHMINHFPKDSTWSHYSGRRLDHIPPYTHLRETHRVNYSRCICVAV